MSSSRTGNAVTHIYSVCDKNRSLQGFNPKSCIESKRDTNVAATVKKTFIPFAQLVTTRTN